MIFGNKTEVLEVLKAGRLVSETDCRTAVLLAALEQNLSESEKALFTAVAALVSSAVSNGNICLSGDDIGEFIRNNAETVKFFRDIDFGNVKAVLKKSSCCTEDPGNELRPLVLMNDRIYFYKYWLYENRFARKMVEISEDPGRYSGSSGKIGEIFAGLFDAGNFEQRSAAENAVKHRFSLITGGPGSGKTTIVAKILVGIYALFPEERIMLAAPTGKASARMTEALKSALEKIRKLPYVSDSGILDRIGALEGTTIHRMLEWKAGGFSRNRKNPLAADLVIVDEAGMLDAALFTSLLDALGKETSLVLLGDKDQLASVGAGNVLSDICSAAEKNLLPPEIMAKLEKSYRFDTGSGIGKLAKAVNLQKNAGEIIEICKNETDCGWTEIKNGKVPESIITDAAKRYAFLSDRESSPEEILKKINDFKILCPSKEGACGVAELNGKIEAALGKNSGSRLYDGMPVMVTKNDYANNLMNGDCGVILERNGRMSAYFMIDNSVKPFSVSSLGTFETVYAMTVHKSQGSEYSSVLIVLPETEMTVLTKEILYTAVTRARNEVVIAAKESILEYTLKKSAARNSGFVEALEKIGKNDKK